MRKVAIVFSIMMVGILCVAPGLLKSSADVADNIAEVTPQRPIQRAAPVIKDPAGTVNGMVTPEKIPDRVAYSLVFRFISSHQDEAARSRVRSYVRQLGLGKKACEASTLPGSEEPDIEAFIAAADEYTRRVGVLDRQVKEIKNRTWPNPRPEVMPQLEQLQKRKDAIVDDIIGSLPRRMSRDGMAALRVSMGERVKRKVKIRPGPASPPRHHDAS